MLAGANLTGAERKQFEEGHLAMESDQGSARKGLHVLILLIALQACSSDSDPALKCASGQRCELRGKLLLFRGSAASAAVLEDANGGCIALALPSEVFDELEKWDEQVVVVTGVAAIQPDSPGLFWYQLRDRRVARGVCDSQTVLYVESLARVTG
jgi:hypothetical protein